MVETLLRSLAVGEGNRVCASGPAFERAGAELARLESEALLAATCDLCSLAGTLRDAAPATAGAVLALAKPLIPRLHRIAAERTRAEPAALTRREAWDGFVDRQTPAAGVPHGSPADAVRAGPLANHRLNASRRDDREAQNQEIDL
ncbi:MAG: hypothetical protein IT384_29090 [Deltaproteobacteria bacterium]|nr:hypothetical protein [Deltaproteobacteria bacterium]